jgi:hypothetical protein
MTKDDKDDSTRRSGLNENPTAAVVRQLTPPVFHATFSSGGYDLLLAPPGYGERIGIS